ncbi:hypothetical protein [Aromatoleum sp.]
MNRTPPAPRFRPLAAHVPAFAPHRVALYLLVAAALINQLIG